MPHLIWKENIQGEALQSLLRNEDFKDVEGVVLGPPQGTANFMPHQLETLGWSGVYQWMDEIKGNTYLEVDESFKPLNPTSPI